VVFANGGHNRPLWLRANGEVQELESKGIVLGLFDEISLEEKRVRLEPGDSLLFYTDGITEAISEQGELFDCERLVRLLEESTGLDPQRIVDRAVTRMFEWLGELPQSDDLTLFMVKRQ
jgi:sigma-B regulation protein RsbU (phosphoserine phosphatase)